MEDGLIAGLSGAALGASIAFGIPTLNPIMTAAIGAVSLPGITLAIDSNKYYKGSVKEYEKDQKKKNIEKSINKIIDKLDREGFDVKYSGDYVSYYYPDEEYLDALSPQKVKGTGYMATPRY